MRISDWSSYVCSSDLDFDLGVCRVELEGHGHGRCRDACGEKAGRNEFHGLVHLLPLTLLSASKGRTSRLVARRRGLREQGPCQSRKIAYFRGGKPWCVKSPDRISSYFHYIAEMSFPI